MGINKAVRLALKALSYGGIDVEASRHLVNLKTLDPFKIFRKALDLKITHDGVEVPLRVYMPSEDALPGDGMSGNTHPVLLFIHGGGWVTESVNTYDRVCANMAEATEHIVVSIDYRLAPEHRFPAGLEDCYAVAKAIFQQRFILNVDPEQITLIGDSAGGNLCAAIAQMARDRGDFCPKREILIYPCTYNDHSTASPYPSIIENGTDFLLTSEKVRDYMNLYKGSEADLQNPYFAPLLAKDFSNLPKTLIITAEYDPLRDEGEDYGRKLKEAGNDVRIYRVKDALHGYFALGAKFPHVQESYEIINGFLKEA